MAEGEKKKILLAESDEFLSSLFKNRLEKEGFSVSVADDGEMASKMIAELKPSLVLMDIILPNKIGFDILEETKNNPELKGVSFMILSNLSQDSDINKAKDLGAVDYFVKSQVIVEDLIKKIVDLLNNA